MSKHLVKLFEEGYVKSEGRAVDHQLVNFYFLANPELGTSYGITEKASEKISFGTTGSKGRKVPVVVQERISRRSRKTGKGEQKIVFRRTGPDMLIDTKEMRKLQLQRKLQDVQDRLSQTSGEGP